MSNKAQAFGLDAELEAKRLAKHDPKTEAEALQLIAELTMLERGDKSVHEFLMDGTVLCKVMNAMKPGSVKKINESKLAFKQVNQKKTPIVRTRSLTCTIHPPQMENINNFLTAAQAYGVPVSDLFQTVDLYEDKNMNQVIIGIHALSRQSWRHDFTGPKIGVKPAEQNKRDFDEATLNAGKFTVSQQMGNNKGASQAGMTAPGARREVDHIAHNNIV